MDIVLIGTVTGQNIDKCIGHVRENINPDKSVLWGPNSDNTYCLENYLVQSFDEMFGIKRQKLSKVLSQPEREIATAASYAIDNLLSDLKEVETVSRNEYDLTFVTLHPVLYHGETRSFISPYQSEPFKDITQDDHISIGRYISVHDDVFDIHENLIGQGKLFDVKYYRDFKEIENEESNGSKETYTFYPRKPIKDISEQRLVLDWRDRELARSRTLASELNVPHFLLHQKTYLQTFWQIATGSGPSVYYSHPISQPRRDWTNTREPGKCRDPQPGRGNQFEERCQNLADELVAKTRVPLVDPTGIDEYRVDMDGVVDVLSGGDSSSHIFPTLTKRWTLSDRNPLFDPQANEIGRQTPTISTDKFSTRKGDFAIEGLHGHTRDSCDEGGECEIDDDTSDRLRRTTLMAERLKGSMEAIKEEAYRQIKVRDYVLTYQSQLLVVYRPFSIPRSFKPTGGVLDEVEAVFNKHMYEYDTCDPSVIILHPWDPDERERRRKAFDAFWSENELAGRYIPDYIENDNLKSDILEVCLEHGYEHNNGDVESEVDTILDNYHVSAEPIDRDSSMGGLEHGRREKSRGAFLDCLLGNENHDDDDFVKSEVFLNTIDSKVEASNQVDSSYVRYIDDGTWSRELDVLVKNALDS
jgi:hypothetical protein